MAGLAAADTTLAKLLKAAGDRRRIGSEPRADELRQLCEATLASVAQARAAAAPDDEAAAAAAASAVFLPFVVALETKNSVLVEEALDGLNEVIAHGLLRDCPDPRDPSSKLVDVLVAAVCGCGCLHDEKVGACVRLLGLLARELVCACGDPCCTRAAACAALARRHACKRGQMILCSCAVLRASVGAHMERAWLSVLCTGPGCA